MYNTKEEFIMADDKKELRVLEYGESLELERAVESERAIERMKAERMKALGYRKDYYNIIEDSKTRF